MKYSIIVPTYNEEKFVEQCLNSIRKQNVDKNEYEVIVSDGASVDSTYEKAVKIADKVIINEKRGASIQRNFGARQAKGDVLVFIDADTHIDPLFIKCLGEKFIDQNTVAVTGIAHPADGGILQRFVYRMTYWLVRVFHWTGVSLFPGMCVAYRRQAFEAVNGFREDFTTLEDLDLSNRISKLGKTYVAGRAIAYSSTRRIQKHLLSTVLYHIFCDTRYLMTGRGPKYYPKSEEINSWKDLWKRK
jgi:glycosyltransferase involved in cell wall biosynthesis